MRAFVSSFISTALTVSISLFAVSESSAADRGMKLNPAPGENSPTQTAWLYLVGIDDYKNVQKLTTAVNDAKALKDLLFNKYQFESSKTLERYNEEATRENIIEDLHSFARKVGPQDSLLIYFAGHGFEDRTTKQMFWVPVDGKPAKVSSFISSSDVRSYIAGIQARHIFLLSDSCFSGSLLSERSLPDQIDERYYREKYKLPSRMIITSGGKEPVADQSYTRNCEGHSVFACYLLKCLRQNEQKYLTPQEIYTTVGPNVSNNSHQTPVIGTLKFAGDEGGEFVMIQRKQPEMSPQPFVQKPVAVPPPAPIVVSSPPATEVTKKSNVNPASIYIEPAKKGVHEHDGFFLRIEEGLGGEYGVFDSIAESVYGLFSRTSFLIGWSVSGNLALGLDLAFDVAYRPNISSSYKNNYNLTYSIGLGLNYYFMPYNIFISSSIGMTSIWYDPNSSEIFDFNYPSYGVLLKLATGKEWWISDHWGLGIAFQYLLECYPHTGHFDNLFLNKFGLFVTATYN